MQPEDDDDIDDFCYHFNMASLPTWNSNTEQYEAGPDTTNPFADGFVLTPEHPSYQPVHQTDTGPVGFYALPASYLGFRPDAAPRFYLSHVNVPREMLFNSAKKANNDPDLLTWDQAMAESPAEVKQWKAAADKEIKALEQKNTFDEVPISEATVKVIPGTWVFRRKRDPATGSILKYKARWVLCGDLQELDLNTYAPVVSWSSVRLFLAICLIQQWVMKAIDFANAFCQSKLREDTPVFAFLPRGFKCMMQSMSGEKTILKLKKSQYGLTIAPKLWYDHLRKAINELGFKASSYDQCMLYRKDMILVTYVDDCGLGAKEAHSIDWFVNELRHRGFELEIEGDFTAFLGVAIERLKDGRIHMHQRGLIKKIIAAAKMDDCNPNHIPASTQGLGSDEDGEPWPQVPWKYSSIVGMLVYLATNTRPDIAYAVSSVRRFNRSPKKSHATAVKMILRYLKGSMDKGIFIKITGTFDLDVYCDADFCGLFGRENPCNPDSARSRGGYNISFGGVPLVWKSWLIARICLSTLESEYTALSKTMVQVIALKNLIEELITGLSLRGMKATIRATVFEDNNGALLLATKQRITSRTKYFLSSWHHFWSHVSQDEGKDGKVVIVKINTSMQGANYLTKGLPREAFENN